MFSPLFSLLFLLLLSHSLRRKIDEPVGSLGASGAIMSVITFYYLRFPKRDFQFGEDMAVPGWVAAIAFFSQDLIIGMLIAGGETTTGIGGNGLSLCIAFTRRSSQRRTPPLKQRKPNSNKDHQSKWLSSPVVLEEFLDALVEKLQNPTSPEDDES
jgi:membrane associated rhomboid family serine protease